MTIATSEAGFLPLRERVMSRLLSGQFNPGDRFFSVREVATWPGATSHLAQRVLAELCRDGYLESVPKKGLFVREVNGKSSGKQRVPDNGWKRLLLLVPPDASPARVNDMLPEFSVALNDKRWRLELVYLPANYADEGGFLLAESLLAREPTAAMWMMPAPGDRLLIRYLVVHGITVVTYNRDFSDTGAYGVVVDTSGVATEMFRHVTGLGRRHVLSLAVDRPSPSIRQFAETVGSLARKENVRVTEVELKYVDDRFPTAEDEARLDRILSAPGRPDAVLCAESYSLLALERWLSQHREVKVPDDLAVASFDRRTADIVVRVLNDIPRGDMDHDAMSRAALDLLESELAGRRQEERVVRVPAVLLPNTPRRGGGGLLL